MAEAARRPVGQNVGEQPGQTAEEDGIMDQEDNLSVMSDSSTDSEDGQEDVMPIVPVPRRRRRLRAELLGPVQGQRLRPRN